MGTTRQDRERADVIVNGPGKPPPVGSPVAVWIETGEWPWGAYEHEQLYERAAAMVHELAEECATVDRHRAVTLASLHAAEAALVDVVPRWKLDQQVSMTRDAIADRDRARAACGVAAADDVWFWQGDEHDRPESLVCPVVMSAARLRGLFDRIAAAESALASAKGALTRIGYKGPLDAPPDEWLVLARKYSTNGACVWWRGPEGGGGYTLALGEAERMSKELAGERAASTHGNHVAVPLADIGTRIPTFVAVSDTHAHGSWAQEHTPKEDRR